MQTMTVGDVKERLLSRRFRGSTNSTSNIPLLVKGDVPLPRNQHLTSATFDIFGSSVHFQSDA